MSEFTNQTAGARFIESHASYSTADIERLLFYGESRKQEAPQTPVQVQVTVVAGQYHVLDEQTLTGGWVSLSPTAALLEWAKEAG